MRPASVPPSAARPAPYSDTIRERWRRPRFRGELPGGNASAEDVNPLCGDRVRLVLEIRDRAIDAARFTGDACAICTASADVLAELITGRPVGQARAVGAADVLRVLGADIRPSRMRCLTLPISVLETALRDGGDRA